jgi:hypothetical protein
MSFLTKLRCRVGAVARSKIRRSAARFLASAADCRGTQHTVLRALIDLNVDSDFAREHDFAGIRDVAGLRARLPVAEYDAFRPYIDRVRQGDHRAFIGSANELLMFSLTSGTTAETKYIPITRRFVDDYRRGWQNWGIRMLDDHFAVNWKNIVQLTSDYDQFRTPGGTPCGNISGLAGAMQKKIVRLMYTLPLELVKITDSEAKYYATLRIALNDPSVGLFTTANPSTLVRLAQLLDRYGERLIRDVADGTLSDEQNVSPEMRRRLGSAISRPRRRRARFLERAVARDGRLTPAGAWPELEMLAVWTGGSCAYYLDQLRELYGPLPIRDHGLHASEGRMTIPLEDETAAGVLDVTSHFYEFVPVAEHGTANPIVLEAHELEVDAEYYILLTTASGLCRYDILDVVRCTGFHGTTPVLEFLHKGAHMASLTGEKLSESQVVTAVRGALNGEAPHVGEFTLGPVWGDPPGYHLLVENRDALTADAVTGLAAKVDDRLQTINCEYREKRETGRLAPLTGVRLAPGTWQRYATERQTRLGSSTEQYKHPCLVPDLDFVARIVALQSPPPPTPGSPRGEVPAPHVKRRSRETVAD